ncbi:MAG TPA: hypothetical protein VF834_17815 [Streptosporangiaceae bacterium]
MSRALTILTYLALFAFGMAQGLLGTFFHGAGPAPLAAIGFALAIFATCLLGGWGMRRSLGGVAPALGWFLLVFMLGAAGTSSGSVLIEASTAGEWFLFGGAVGAMAGLVASVVFFGGLRRTRPTGS